MLGGGRGRGAERKSCGGPCTVCNILLLGLRAQCGGVGKSSKNRFCSVVLARARVRRGALVPAARHGSRAGHGSDHYACKNFWTNFESKRQHRGRRS